MTRPAGLIGALAALWLVSPALADGIGPQQYRYVHPPRFLKATNAPPNGGSQTTPLSEKGQSFFAYTSDLQAGVSYDHGAFGLPARQRSISITIQPLSRFPALPRGGLVEDGNVYRFTYRYLPSGSIPSHSHKPVLLQMAAPHTPTEMLGRTRGAWRVLCGENALLFTINAVECYTHTLDGEVVLLYKPFGRRVTPKAKARAAVSLPVIAAIVVVVLGAAAVASVLLRGRKRGSIL